MSPLLVAHEYHMWFTTDLWKTLKLVISNLLNQLNFCKISNQHWPGPCEKDCIVLFFPLRQHFIPEACVRKWSIIVIKNNIFHLFMHCAHSTHTMVEFSKAAQIWEGVRSDSIMYTEEYGELRACVYNNGKNNIPLAVCQISNSCLIFGYCSLIVFLIDAERSVVITFMSWPKSKSSVMPLLNPSGSMAPELVASVD